MPAGKLGFVGFLRKASPWGGRWHGGAVTDEGSGLIQLFLRCHLIRFASLTTFRPFWLLRLPSFLWSACGVYPTRPEICRRHIFFSGLLPKGEARFSAPLFDKPQFTNKAPGGHRGLCAAIYSIYSSSVVTFSTLPSPSRASSRVCHASTAHLTRAGTWAMP